MADLLRYYVRAKGPDGAFHQDAMAHQTAPDAFEYAERAFPCPPYREVWVEDSTGARIGAVIRAPRR